MKKNWYLKKKNGKEKEFYKRALTFSNFHIEKENIQLPENYKDYNFEIVEILNKTSKRRVLKVDDDGFKFVEEVFPFYVIYVKNLATSKIHQLKNISRIDGLEVGKIYSFRVLRKYFNKYLKFHLFDYEDNGYKVENYEKYNKLQEKAYKETRYYSKTITNKSYKTKQKQDLKVITDIYNSALKEEVEPVEGKTLDEILEQNYPKEFSKIADEKSLKKSEYLH